MNLAGFSADKITWFRAWVLKKNFMEVVELHFQLSEAVKKHYRLRADEKHLAIAISACEYMICISDIVMDALIAKELYKIYEYEQVIGEYPYPKTFFRPRHHGYTQLGVLLRKHKHHAREEQLNIKMVSEGWGLGEMQLPDWTESRFIKIGK